MNSFCLSTCKVEDEKINLIRVNRETKVLRRTARTQGQIVESRKNYLKDWRKESQLLSAALTYFSCQAPTPTPPVWLDWITSLTGILVTVYWFTLRLTHQSVTRAGSSSVHASCSQTFSRGRFKTGTKETQNVRTIWLLAENRVRIVEYTLNFFFLFSHVSLNQV